MSFTHTAPHAWVDRCSRTTSTAACGHNPASPVTTVASSPHSTRIFTAATHAKLLCFFAVAAAPVGEQCQIARPPPPLVTTTTCKDLAIVIYDITCSREGTISQASIFLFSSRTSTSSRAEIQSTLKKEGGSFLSPSNTGNNFLSDSLNVQVEKLVDIGVSTVDGPYVGMMKSMLKA